MIILASPNELSENLIQEIRDIENETDSPIVQEAFSNLLSYESVDSPVNILVRTGEDESDQDELYRFDLDITDHTELNTREEYPSVLLQMKDKALDTE